jgi:hypothetical protein
VWDDAWKYTPDDQPCMKIWFDGEKGNPNDNIAKLKVEHLMRQRNRGVQGTGSLPNFFLAAIFMVVFVRL